MKNFRSLTFKEAAGLFSKISNIEMIAGQLVLTTRRNLSNEELEIMFSKHFKELGLDLISCKVDQDEDEFFCEVKDIIPHTSEKIDWLKSTVNDFKKECGRRELISVNLVGFLVRVNSTSKEEPSLEYVLEQINSFRARKLKIPWKGYNQKTQKELRQALIDMGVSEDRLLEYF